MAKKVIILRTWKTSATERRVEAILWLDVQAGREIPDPAFDSRYTDASQSETTALRDGSVIEKDADNTYANNVTKDQIKTALEAEHTAEQAALNAKPDPNAYYGEFWDGSTWST